MKQPNGAWQIHYRMPYFRPSWQGGDTHHPLCMIPLTGWAGPPALRFRSTAAVENVDCPHCQVWLAAGGAKARKAALVAMLAVRPTKRPRKRQSDWRTYPEEQASGRTAA